MYARHRLYAFFNHRCDMEHRDPRTNLTQHLHDMIHGRLESLELTEGYPISGWGLEFPLRLGLFSRLIVLSLHGSSFSGPDLTTPTSMIPSQLECLRIYCDEKSCPYFFLFTVYRRNTGGQFFPHLRQIELFLKYIVCVSRAVLGCREGSRRQNHHVSLPESDEEQFREWE